MDAAQRAALSPSERLVCEALEAKGLRVERFSRAEMRAGKTPDFKVYKEEDFAFCCEVKEIAPDEVMGARPDPVFNRLTDDIHDAVQKFDAVNPSGEQPNVLAFVNNDRRTGSLDLVGVITGCLLLEGDEAAPIYTKFSEGRIRDEKKRIDLYLWFDSFKANKVFFNFDNRRHFERLCALFGIDAAVVGDLRDRYRPAKGWER